MISWVLKLFLCIWLQIFSVISNGQGFPNTIEVRRSGAFLGGEVREEWVLGSGNLTSSDFEHDLCVPIKVQEKKRYQKRYRINDYSQTKWSFYWVITWKLLGEGGRGRYETLVWNNNLVEEGHYWGWRF